jgi:hypothetical protein
MVDGMCFQPVPGTDVRLCLVGGGTGALSHPSKSEVHARPLATAFCLCLRAFLFHGHGVAGWPGHGASATLAQCTGGPRQVKWVAYDSSADDLARPLRGDSGLGE